VLIPLPIGSLRVATLACIAHHVQILADDKVKLSDKVFGQLRDGAVHNGMNPSATQLQEMREMANRDVEHAMGGHPSADFVEHCKVMLAASAYTEPTEEVVVVDMQEFKLLQDFLPPIEDTKEG
jgi:hypothetical protein